MGEQPEMREARLRPEFAALYPGLEPGTWQDAAALAEQMLSEHLLRPSPGYMLSDRVLAKEHFEFRGGNHSNRPRLTTLLTCYQHADEATMLKVMQSPAKLVNRRAGGSLEKL